MRSKQNRLFKFKPFVVWLKKIKIFNFKRNKTVVHCSAVVFILFLPDVATPVFLSFFA